MPKMTSTPTASSERTRLCAPVMPVAGSTAGGAVVDGRSVVSTPARDAAASRLADSSGGVVLIAAISWRAVRAGGGCGRLRGGGPARRSQKKNPPGAGNEGKRVGRGDRPAKAPTGTGGGH